MCLAIPGVVRTVDPDPDVRMAWVDFGGVTKRICIEHVPDARPGEYLLVHVGFALTRLDVEDAARLLATLEQMGRDLADDEAGS